MLAGRYLSASVSPLAGAWGRGAGCGDGKKGPFLQLPVPPQRGLVRGTPMSSAPWRLRLALDKAQQGNPVGHVLPSRLLEVFVGST